MNFGDKGAWEGGRGGNAGIDSFKAILERQLDTISSLLDSKVHCFWASNI